MEVPVKIEINEAEDMAGDGLEGHHQALLEPRLHFSAETLAQQMPILQERNAVEFTDANTATLIQLYAQETLLWDKGDTKYSSKTDRVAALTRISAAFNYAFSIDDIRSKIANLRTQYNREQRSIEKMQEKGFTSYYSNWRYFAAMHSILTKVSPGPMTSGNVSMVTEAGEQAADAAGQSAVQTSGQLMDPTVEVFVPSTRGRQVPKLIALYQRYTVLYDHSHPFYNSISARNKALHCIALAMGGMEVDEVRNKIQSLRASYARELRHLSKYPSEMVPRVRWRHFYQLDTFLRKHMATRQPTASVRVGDADEGVVQISDSSGSNATGTLDLAVCEIGDSDESLQKEFSETSRPDAAFPLPDDATSKPNYHGSPLNSFSPTVEQVVQGAPEVATTYSHWKMELSDVQTEQLIDLFRKHNVLYNPSHPHYMSRQRRQEVYKMISAALGNTGVGVIISKLKSLRSTYGRELRRLRRAAPGHRDWSEWKYFDRLDCFLRQYMTFRQPLFNVQEDANERDHDGFPSSCDDDAMAPPSSRDTGENEACRNPIQERSQGVPLTNGQPDLKMDIETIDLDEDEEDGSDEDSMPRASPLPKKRKLSADWHTGHENGQRDLQGGQRPVSSSSSLPVVEECVSQTRPSDRQVSDRSKMEDCDSTGISVSHHRQCRSCGTVPVEGSQSFVCSSSSQPVSGAADDLFSKYISTELAKIRNRKTLNSLKIQIQQLIYDAQVEEDEDNGQ